MSRIASVCYLLLMYGFLAMLVALVMFAPDVPFIFRIATYIFTFLCAIFVTSLVIIARRFQVFTEQFSDELNNNAESDT